MIVICQRCQAKFRVPDEKIPARGAKVRCSKCQAVFVVHREALADAAEPAGLPPERVPTPPGGLGRPPGRASRREPRTLDVDLEPRAPAAPPPLPPGATDPFGLAAADPFASPPPPADDPFAAAAFASTFAAAPAPRTAPDPFGADPFGLSGDGPGPAADLLAQATSGLAERASSPASAQLAATDLADLLGSPGARTGPPPLPSGLAPDAPGPAGERPASLASGDLGIALEERVTPPAFHVPGAAFESGLEGFGGPLGDPRSFEHGNLELPPAHGGSLALATEPTPGAPAAALDPWPAPPPALPPDAPEGGAPAPARGRAARRLEDAPGVEPQPVDRIPGGRSSPVRTAVVNAVVLAALVLVALAGLVLWRGEGRMSPAALPAAIAGALRGGAPAGPFVAKDLRNGLYEREKAHPLLFVRGTVVARPGAPAVGAVRVEVELVKDGVVLARGEAVAGAVPTPEELWRAADARALAAVVAGARSRAPARIRAGDAVPFLVALAEYPADLSGTAVRVALGRAEARR